MSTAELNKKKLDLIAWINRLSDENIIEFLDGLKSSKAKEDWWDELSISQQKMIRNGMDDIENGNVISSSQFWNKLKNGWEKRLVVEYSTQSLNNATEIVAYLRRQFTQKEVDNFYQALTDFEGIICLYPTLYSESRKTKIRRAVLNKVLSVYYSIKKNKINIVAILNNRWDESSRIK